MIDGGNMERYFIVQETPEPPAMKPHYDDLTEALAAVDHVRKTAPAGVRVKLVRASVPTVAAGDTAEVAVSHDVTAGVTDGLPEGISPELS